MKTTTFYIISIILLTFSVHTNAQELGISAPSAEFINYRQTPPDSSSYIPLPFTVSKTTTAKRSGDIPPAQYDSRNVNGTNYILAPRNQVITGPCWAFAATDAVQASFYRKGYEEGYLSPQLLSTCHNFVYTRTQGGNSLMAMATFARLVGPAYETAVPYSTVDATCSATTKDDYPAFVSDVYILADRNSIKKAIMENGSVASKMYYDNTYYNNVDDTYYYNGSLSENHGISIVGWDDNKVVPNKGYGAPAAAGAWIVKGTWGTSFGDEGFFYTSYEDTYTGVEAFAFTKRVNKNTIDKVYQYAQHGMTNAIGYTANTPIFGRIKFSTPTREKVVAIGLYTFEPNTEVQFWIYEGADLTKLRYASEAKTIEFGGYYTMDIPQPLYINGDYQVIVRYKHATEPYPMPVEVNFPDYNNATIQPIGVQWTSSSGSSWSNVGNTTVSSKFNLCINAYTFIPIPPTNDNVENATLLAVNTLYTDLSNAGATVETNEPAPPLTDCTSQTSWCNEGGLQNSVWFKFVATNPMVNIITEGFDNQIALWQANDDNWENLVGGNTANYQLIAANDDASPSNVSGTLSNVTGLEIGKTYFIQVDGSANGSEGTFSIEIEDVPTGINQTEQLALFGSDGELLPEILSSLTKIEMYDTEGRLISVSPKDNIRIPKLLKDKVYIVRLFFTDGSTQSVSILK